MGTVILADHAMARDTVATGQVLACGRAAAAYREPSAILLAAQLGAVLLYPFMEDSEVGRALFSVFGVLILGLVVRAVRLSPGHMGFVAAWPPRHDPAGVQAVTRDDTLVPYSSALEAILYFYAAGALIAYMLADHEITRDELFASARRSRSSHGRSPTRTSSARRSTPAASRPRRTRRPTGPGWSCST